MSGPNPSHLGRRRAIYFIRLRVPPDLIRPLDLTEFRRSLLTKDPATARRLCVMTTAWFRATMDQLRSMPKPTRADLEDAARQHFARMSADLDKPRQFHPIYRDEEIALNVEASERRIAELEDQLRDNIFDRPVRMAAERLAALIGADIETFTERQTTVAQQLAAQAEREQHRKLIHLLLHPGEPFQCSPLFERGYVTVPSRRVTYPTAARAIGGPLLQEVVDWFLKKKAATGIGESQKKEIARALGWLVEEIGADYPFRAITKEQLRAFRDDLTRINVKLRGRDGPFKDRLTDQVEHQIKSVTSKRYWGTIQALFAKALSEGQSDADPSVGIEMEGRRNEEKRTPPPFSVEEVKRLLGTPLYAGSKSMKRLLQHGPVISREGRWWSGLLALHTGMRAGELCQLETSNFHFDEDIPFVTVTTIDEDGKRTKKTKNSSSTRDIPLHPVLIELGIRDFVRGRAKRGGHVFFEFRAGSNGRKAEGMTAFWGRYLPAMGLWEPGRSTHVFRHTVADRLRAVGVIDEDIGAILGHSGRTQTSRYGGQQGLERKALAIARLDYGFDVVAFLKGHEAALKAAKVDGGQKISSDGDMSVV